MRVIEFEAPVQGTWVVEGQSHLREAARDYASEGSDGNRPAWGAHRLLCASAVRKSGRRSSNEQEGRSRYQLGTKGPCRVIYEPMALITFMSVDAGMPHTSLVDMFCT